MTSRNLFSKLMNENTKQRLWTVALISVIFFFAFPVQVALNISNSLDTNRLNNAVDPGLALVEAQTQLSRFFMNWCGIQNGMLIFMMFLFAAICGVSGFAYLHSRKKTDFYHSLPVRREKLFAAQYVNGILYVAVPYLICMLIAAVMLSVKEIEIAWGGIFKGYLMHMAFYLLLYSTVILAVVMTGNVIVSFLGMMVFFLWAPLVSGLTQGYFQTYFATYYNNNDLFLDWCCRLSPAAWYIRAAFAEGPELMAVKGFFAAAVITAAAVILYKKRPSEAAGRAMAFPVSQPIIKVLLVVPVALLGSLMFQSMMNRDTWSIFGLLCGLILSYCVIEIIYNFDFRRLFAHKRQMVLCGVISGAILAFFRFDFSGYDSYLPSEDRLVSAGIYCYVMDGDTLDKYHAEPELIQRQNNAHRYVIWNYMRDGELAELMHLEDTEPVIQIAQQGIADAQRMRETQFTSGRYRAHSWRDGKYMREVIVAYHLQNGKTVLRSYQMDLSAVREQLDAVHDQKGYKDAIYPVLSWQAEEIAGINYREQNDCSHVMFKDETQKAELLEVYQKELAALTADTRRRESPVGEIQFKTHEVQEIIDELRAAKGDYSAFNRYLYYPVYPSFTETIQLLADCGIEAGGMLTSENVEKIVLQYTGVFPSDVVGKDGQELSRPEVAEGTAAEYVWKNWDDMESRSGNPSVTITEKEEIQAILDASISKELGVTNSYNEEYNGINVMAYVPYTPAWKAETNAGDESEGTEVTPETAVETESVEVLYEAEAAYSTYSPYVMDSDASYQAYALTFDRDKIPSFVEAEFGLTDELMEYDTEKSY